MSGLRARRAGITIFTVLSLLLLAEPSLARDKPVELFPEIGLDRVFVLPEYCDYSQDGKYGYNASNPTPAHQRWIALLGPALHHIHHYCRGLKAAQKARDVLIPPQLRMSLYESVIKECMYVVENSPSDLVLLPEIFLRMGQAAFANRDVGRALAFYEKSRQAKSDYWPAYIEIARTNLSFGRRDEAISALKAGLEVMPDEARLRQALDRLSSQAFTSGSKRTK